MRTSFSLLVLLPVLVGRGGSQRIRLPRPDLIQCLVLGMLGVAASNYFYYVAIQKTSVAIAIVLQYTAPIAGHRILARYDRWRVLTWTLASSAVFWLIVNPPWKVVAAHYTPAQWAFLFVFSMISVLGSFSLYFLGLQHLEPTRAIIASCLEPVFSILLAAALLGEGVRPVQTLGIVLVLSAIVIVQLPGKAGTDQDSVVIDPIE